MFRLIFLFALLFLSCKNDVPQKEANQIANNSADDLSIYQTFLVTVDHLNVRSEPGRTGDILGKLREYEVVYGTNDISQNIDTIELRGRQYIEPYHRVKTSQGDGWLYGGALSIIYGGTDTVSFPRASELAKDLYTIPKDKITVTYWMVNRISDEDLSNPNVNDAYLVIALDAIDNIPYDSPIYEEAEKFEWTAEDYEAVIENKLSPDRSKYVKDALNSGFRFIASEGMIFPELDREKFAGMIGGPFTPAMKSYLSILSYEMDNPIMEDAAIIVPLAEIGKQWTARKKFQSAYPHFVYDRQNKNDMDFYLNAIKYGTSNTPAFDYDTRLAYQQFELEWSNLIQKMPNSKIAEEIESWVQKVADSDGREPAM